MDQVADVRKEMVWPKLRTILASDNFRVQPNLQLNSPRNPLLWTARRSAEARREMIAIHEAGLRSRSCRRRYPQNVHGANPHSTYFAEAMDAVDHYPNRRHGST